MRINLAEQLATHLGLASRPADLRITYSKFGMAEISGSGLWSAEYVDAHFEDLEKSLTRIRSEFGRALVLVDLSKAPDQSTETAERIAYWTGRIYRDVDRVAIVVDSSSLKEQMRRRVMVAVFDVFISEVAARLWLFER